MKGIIKQILLATCLIGAPTSVFAYPFNPNPQSFQDYMNAVKWTDGSRVIFQNLNACMDFGNDTYYGCQGGYATVSNPLGTQVCSLTSVIFHRWIGVKYTTGNCRYK
jgi:hypothetical protein